MCRICTYIYRVYKKSQTENLMQLRYSKIFKISFASIGELGHDWYTVSSIFEWPGGCYSPKFEMDRAQKNT